MQEVVGIYNADGTIGGELSYALAKLARRGSCELCDVTHGWNPLGNARGRLLSNSLSST